MLLKYSAVGIVCLAIGFFTRGAMDSIQEVEGGAESNLRTKSTEKEVSGRQSDLRGARRKARSIDGDGGDLLVASGLPKPDDTGLLVVPDTLLEHLAKSNRKVSSHDDLFSSDNSIEEILQISDREKANIQNAWMKTRKKFRQLQAINSESVTLEDGSVQITMPNLESQVSELRDGFYKVLNDQLGKNRAGTFAASRFPNNALFNQSGEVVYTIKVESIGNGRWRYRMSQKGPEGNRVWVGENIPRSIRHLTDAANIRSNLNPVGEEDDEE